MTTLSEKFDVVIVKEKKTAKLFSIRITIYGNYPLTNERFFVNMQSWDLKRSMFIIQKK